MQHTDPLKSIAAFDQIVWLDGNHLAVEDCHLSPFEKALHVKQVCWLEVNTQVKSMERGCYEVLWRVEGRGMNGWDSVPLEATAIEYGTLTPEVDSSKHVLKDPYYVEHSLYVIDNTGWTWVFSKSLLRVRGQFAEVKLSISEIDDGNWKSGMSFDCVALRKLSDDPDYQCELKHSEPARDVFLKRTMFPRLRHGQHHVTTITAPSFGDGLNQVQLYMTPLARALEDEFEEPIAYLDNDDIEEEDRPQENPGNNTTCSLS